MSYSNVTIIGNLTRAPESHGKVITGTVACNYNEKNRDGTWVKRTAFVDFKSWSEKMLDLEKGSKVLIEGGIRQENWTGKDDKPRSKLVVAVSTWRNLSERKPTADPSQPPSMENMDDNPF